MSEIDEADDTVNTIKLGPDRLFRIEIGQRDEYLRIGLKEINVNPPNYYESFYTKEDLENINDLFKPLQNIDSVVKQLSKFIKYNVTLKSDIDETIIVSFIIPCFAEEEVINFHLEKKNIAPI